MSEEVAISEVSSNGASLSSPSKPIENLQDSGISHTPLTEAQGQTEAASVNSTSASPLLSTISSAPSVEDISWDLGHYETGVAKNLLSDISEEQMSKLDEVLSLDEVQEFLQQTGSNTFSSEMSEAPPPGSAPGLSAQDKATPFTADDKSAGNRKTELFSASGEPLKLEDLDLDDETAHEIIKKGIREQDLAHIAVSFSDHAYALAPDKESKTAGTVAMATPSSSSTASPSAKKTTMATTTPSSTPRKSSRIAKRKGIRLEETVKSEEESRTGTEEEGGKSADTEEETSRMEDSEDGRKGLSEEEPTKGKGRGKKKVQAVPRPTRRSTRISEHEQREMAEKIRQENLRKEKEEMDAMMKAKEEERLQAEELEKEKQEKEDPKKEQESEEKVEEDSQQEEEKSEVSTQVTTKPAGRGRGRGRKVGAKAEVKPGAKAVASGVQTGKKPRGRGRGRGKKAGTDESEVTSQTQSSSTEDEVPLRTLTKKGRKGPRKGAKVAPAEAAPSDAKKKETVTGPVGSDAEDSVPLGKLKTEAVKSPNTGSEVKSPEVKTDTKTVEKKGPEDQKPRAIGTRQRRPTGRKSESEIQALSSASDLFKPDAVIVHQQTDEGRQPTGEAGCQADEESDGGLSYEDDENDSDWDPGENIGKLWCICKKPHGNRFMICCDKCQGWFHGRCVGISKARGKEMEQRNEEYVCPVCTAEKLKQPADVVDVSFKTESETKQEKKEGKEVSDSKTDVKIKIEEASNKMGSKVRTETKEELDLKNKIAAEAIKETSEKPKDIKPAVKQEERSFLSAISGLSQSSETVSDTTKPELKSKGEKPVLKTEKSKDSKKVTKPEVKSYGEKIDKTLGEIRKRAAQVLAERKKKRFKGLGDHKRTFERCIVEGCGQESRPDSVYCSDQCIGKYSEDSLHIIRQERERNQGHRRSSTEGAKKAAAKVVVMERRTGRVLTGPSAPSESNLGEWLRTHPSFEVLRPAHASHKITTSFYKKDKGDNKDSKHSSSHHSTSSSHHHSGSSHHHSGSSHHHSGSSHHHSSSAHSSSSSAQRSSSGPNQASTTRDDTGPDPVRLNVRRSLRDVLAHRANEADDIMLSNSEIKKIALSIEEELYNLFQETGTKYKAKYRSLIFNIKDLKNKGLFRKILTTQIKAQKLVRMTPEELASKELAKWREMENKHTLEMIEMAEKEAQEEAGKQHVTKKTHKGVEEVADEDLSSLVNAETEEKKPKITSPVVSPAGLPGDLLSSLIVDTTEQHRMHLFDLNCKVCTGKVAPPSAEEPPPKKVKVARTVSKESTEGLPAEKTEEPLPDVVEEKEVKEVLKVIEKAKAEEELAASTAADSTSVTVRSPDSALQSGLEITPRGHMVGAPALWKGFVHMQDLARFVTSAHSVSGPTQHLTLPDSIQLCGRIAPEQVWDYLARIKKAGSKDICVIRFDPSGGEEKAAYVQLYSYLNSRSRCGVCGNNSKQIKDLYIVPLAAHCKIPSILLPFDGPGLQENRPHMLIGIVVKQKVKRPSESGPPEASSKAISTDGPSQVKRLKQPIASRTPPRKSALDPRKLNPLDPRERARGGTLLKASPLQRDDASADEQSFTPPELSTPPSRDPPKPKINDPIVQVYGQVDLKKLEEDASAGKAVAKPSEAAVEEDEPYDPEDMEGILMKPGLRSKAGSVSLEETAITAKTADIPVAKNTDHKSLLMDLTRKVEEQKREIQLKKLGLESKTTTVAEPASLAPTLSTLITTLKAANLNLMERAAATASHQPPVSKPPVSTSTNWDEIIKANIGSVPEIAATTTKQASSAPSVQPSKAVQGKEVTETTVKIPDPRRDKEQRGSEKDSVHRSEKEEHKAKEPEKSKADQPKGSDHKKSRDSPRHESSRSSSSPDRRHSRRSPKSRDSRRHSRSPGRRREDSNRKDGPSRRRSRSSERRSSDSRRSGDSRSSSHRSRRSDRDRDRDRDDGHSRRDSRSPRDKSRSHRSEKPRMSSAEKERDARGSSREQVVKESTAASTVDKGKPHKDPARESVVASTTAVVSTSGVVIASAVSSETVEGSALQATPVVHKQNKTESQILDDLVLGKQNVPNPPKCEAAAVPAEGGKDSTLKAEPETTSANLPTIPGFGFETTIPMSEISDILKNISRVTASANSNVVSGAESLVSTTIPTAVSVQNDNQDLAGSPKPSVSSHGGNVTSASGVLGELRIPVTVTEGKGDIDYRKQTPLTTLPGPPLPVMAGPPPPPVLLQGAGPLGPPQVVVPVAQPRDVDLRRGDVPREVGSVFLSMEDKDMRVNSADVGLSLGSGDSDMRVGSGDKDMRVRLGDLSGPGPFPGGRNTSSAPFDQRPQGRNASPAPQPVSPPCMPLQPPPLPPHLLRKQVYTGDKDDRVVPLQGPSRTGVRPPGVETIQAEPSHGGPRDFMRHPGPPGRQQVLGQTDWQQFPQGQFDPSAGQAMEKLTGGTAPPVSGRPAPPPGSSGLLPSPRPQLPTGSQPGEGRPIETITSSGQDERHQFPQHQFGQRMPVGMRPPFRGPGPHGQGNRSESDSNSGSADFVRHPSVLARGGPQGGRMMHGPYRGGSAHRPPPPPPPGRGMMGPRGPHPNIPRFSRGRGRGW